ncbi:MAG: ribonuclease E/G [Rhodospirillaceae bacterium]|jgi:ribonuclease E|nr:ribonuclease E/G [Rhodospirillaceae bacterium]MBT4588058.1 ribonuclease E/G [Rhodospirillaceae bacterium]
MATKRMLIDAAHPEEIRVAVMDGNQLEELDVESAARRQLKGNIYLAKVTRVEPSLQAAFVDYGGNRHGFLAFSEIHPDYYQIPIADREELLAEESAASENDDEADDDVEDAESTEGEGKSVEEVGGDDIDEVETRRKFFPAKRYKIQEVIKRRQILLVQVVKEERGNKGAALTTYMSLAGRYCVLMPNTGKGGGISRKIASGSDRKRLKTIINEFDIPQGMAVIVRTAGADRSKAEIKRDYEYLIKLWSGVRDTTLESTAPALIHEEASIIKRAVRDHYSKDVEEVIVEGDDGYRQAKDLMKLLVPSHAKKVQPYKDPIVPLFNRYHIEAQLETMNSSQVQLKAGGYIVIDITEALIAVDVNSGRATRGRNIEETALKTNLEAATEVARQLRLRDLAGLVVIDFIDMEVHRNQNSVERRLKEAMRKDRARIQIGRISPFGLLELSRQRLRPSITETMTEVCPHCGGSGIRRSIESTALHVLRGVEEEGARQRVKEIEVFVHSQVALYILNQKREAIAEIEQKFEIKVIILEDDNLIPPDYSINRTVTNKQANADSRTEVKSSGGQNTRSGAPDRDEESDDQPKKKRRRRSRRRRPNDEDGAQSAQEGQEASLEKTESKEAVEPIETTDKDGDESKKPTRRRRGRRGGRRRNRSAESSAETATEETATTQETTETPAEATTDTPSPEATEADDTANDASAETASKADTDEPAAGKPKRRRVRRKKAAAPKAEEASSNESDAKSEKSDEPVVVEAAPEPTPEPEVAPEPEKTEEVATAQDAQPDAEPSYNPNVTVVGEADEAADGENRGGWWNKITGS